MIVAVAAMSFVCCGGNASKTAEAEAEAPVEAVAEEAAEAEAPVEAVAEEAAEAEVVAAE